MSVLIKGMKAPRDCHECEFEYTLYVGDCHCSLLDDGRVETYIDKRADNCPIVEIPTEHGRLIDADRMDLQSELFTFTRYTGIDEAPLEDATSIIDKAPTVVPSEHGDLIDRDALPPVTPTQRTGKWIHHGDYDAIECSLCGAAFPDELSANYCPSCGAKMDGGDDNG